MEELNFKLEVFEGPLDLLLSLISKNKVQIADIPIALIFDQYMEYLDAMRAMDMDIAGEFIVMASELMLIKSRMLLPRQTQEEEDPRARLAAALLEYQKAKERAALLAERYLRYDGRIVKDPEVIDTDTELGPHTILMLENAFRRILRRQRTFEENALQKKQPEQMLSGILIGKPVPVAAKILFIMRYLYRFGDTELETLLLTSRSRSELIASFVGLLELIRSQRVTIAEADFDQEHILLHLNKEKHTPEGAPS